MINRGLRLLLKNGLNQVFTLPISLDSEIKSTEEFINAIESHKDTIHRFRSRNPNLVISKKLVLLPDILDVLHSLLNARKYIDLPVVEDLRDIDQLFEIDMVSGSFTVHQLIDNNHQPIGTMYFDHMFSNWKEMFYGIDASVSSDEELMLDSDKLESLLDDEKEDADSSTYTAGVVSKYIEMTEKLSDIAGAVELWEYIRLNFSEILDDESKVIVMYSGGGDSGEVDEVYIQHPDGTRTDVTDKDQSFYDEIERLSWIMVGYRESGFENDEGGEGVITIALNSFSWNHSNYYTESHKTVEENISI